MGALRFQLILVWMTSLSAVSISNAQTVPVVYQDENIAVAAGIVESGAQSIHIGDALTLLVDVEFNAREVKIETLDDDFIQRMFAATPYIRQYRPGDVEISEGSKSQVRVTAQWQLQILDCPPDMNICPGNNEYDLPLIALAYQLADSDGLFSEDFRSVRFKPWPGNIQVAAALGSLPETDSKLVAAIPGGAYPAPLAVDAASPTIIVLGMLGLFLLGAGRYLASRERRPSGTTLAVAAPSSRWELALHELFDDAITNDQWSDLLRRSFAWYCTDQLHINPYSWLGSAAVDRPDTEPGIAALRTFFIEILSSSTINREDRSRLRNRMLELTGHSGYAREENA